MTDEWLYPILLKEEEKVYESYKPKDDEQEDDVYVDKGINIYFEQNGI